MKTTITRRAGFGLSIITLGTLLFAGASSAQTDFRGSVHFDTGFPRGELAERVDRDAYGLGGQIFFAPSTSPLSVGLDLSWMNYGSVRRSEPFSTTIPDVRVDVETANDLVQGFFVLRAQMPGGPIQLYGDGLIGFNYLYTETRIEDDGFGSEVASATNHDDVALAYGFGGGIMIPVWVSDFGTDSIQQAALDVGVRYVKGGEAEYLKEGSIRRENGEVVFDPIRSRTDLVRLHVGVTLSF